MTPDAESLDLHYVGYEKNKKQLEAVHDAFKELSDAADFKAKVAAGTVETYESFWILLIMFFLLILFSSQTVTWMACDLQRDPSEMSHCTIHDVWYCKTSSSSTICVCKFCAAATITNK